MVPQERIIVNIVVIACFIITATAVVYGSYYRKKQPAIKREKPSTLNSAQSEDNDAKVDSIPQVEKNVVEHEECITTANEAPKKTIIPGQNTAIEATRKYKAECFEEAIELYSRAIEESTIQHNPDHKNIKVMYSNRAASYEKLGDSANVIKDCTEALRLDPGHSKSFLRRSKARLFSKDYFGALSDFVCLVLLSEHKNEELDESLATQIEEAHKVLTETETARLERENSGQERFLPDDYFIASYLSSFHPDDDENDVHPMKSSNYYTGSISSLTEGNEDKLGELLTCRGLVYKKERKYAQASKDFNQGCQVLKPGMRAYYTAQIESGLFHHLKGDFETAKACFEAALKEKPDSLFSFIRLGGLCFDQKDLPGALEWFQKAFAIKPDCPTAYFHRGQLRSIDVSLEQSATAEGLREAIEDLTHCIGLASDFAMAYMQLGVLHTRVGAFDLGTTYLKVAAELIPDAPEAYNYLGEIYMQMLGHPESSVTLEMVENMFEKAIEVDPTYPMAYINKGSILAQKNPANAQDALGLFKKAIEMSPRSKLAYVNLAQVYLAMQAYDLAVEQIDQAVKLVYTSQEYSELAALRVTASAHAEAKKILGRQ
uniref:Mitochondrial import receptor subunit TOM70 putative n=1 Tax=Albugo laibachii Nc14 TaxID=890382 RepID=F0WCI7_9STRA|nr:mitochondrial import receptor subunit TOM70 putative [Albugo laibachii Nc14]|eukprot:CCA18904.1 mitochondrial import receptor subunit TOM70 putative [Albugo laibachii Nc14]